MGTSCSSQATRELREIELATQRAKLRAIEEETSRKDAEWVRDHPKEAHMRAQMKRAQREARDVDIVALRQEIDLREKIAQLNQARPDPLFAFAAGAALGMVLG